MAERESRGRSRRTDVLPNDVPLVPPHMMRNEDSGDTDSYSSRGRRVKGLHSSILKQLKDLDVTDVDDARIIQMMREGNREGNYLLFCKHYRYILHKIIEITQVNWYSDDILQAGAVGLYEAAKRWDESKKCTFLTYAHYWILKFIYIEIRNELLPLGGLGLGRDAKERLFNFIKYIMMGYSDEEIMERLRINEKTLKELKILNSIASRTKSLDNVVDSDNEEEEAYNQIGVPSHPSAETEYLNEEFLSYVEKQVNDLRKTEPKLAEFLDLELGLNGQYQLEKPEICAALNITKREYSQMKRAGNRYLRIQMIGDGWYDAPPENETEGEIECRAQEKLEQLQSNI